MNKPMSSLYFNGMTVAFQVRDFLRPRADVLKEVGIRPGFWVLDYGCGPGGYIVGAAKLVGESGKVYALDIHPLAIQRVQSSARKGRLTNIETIQSDCQTGLPDNSIDVVLLYDVFHGLNQPEAVLGELDRVLKTDGTLSFNDHHMHEMEILSKLTSGGLFKLSGKGKHTYSFSKQAGFSG